MLDVMMVRTRFMARKPRGQRLGRLRPVDDGDRNQRKADEDGEPDEKTAALHDRAAYGFRLTVASTPECNAALRGIACDADLEVVAALPLRPSRPGTATPPAVQYETATLGSPFRSPSRFHFRPPAPLTFGFRLLPSVPASTYLRSVLGANRNLGEGGSFRKRSKS